MAALDRTIRFRSWIIESILILVLAGVTYLPQVTHLTLYQDDWYYATDGQLGGASIYHQMFQIDRPARGYVFEAYFNLFGNAPLPYHVGEFAWRMLAALAALWLFRLIWPQQRFASWVMALLFVLYPGYWWWVAGYEYQPMIMSLALEVLSIALTVRAIKARSGWSKSALWVASILTGWAYIALVDYAIGMEVFRFLCVYLMVNRGQVDSFLSRVWRSLRAWVIAVAIPLGFLVWRVFIFQNTRKETDIGVQLGTLLSSPVQNGMWWLLRLGQSTLNTLLMAWVTPFYDEFFKLRLKEFLVAFGLGALGLVALFAAFRYFRKDRRESAGTPENSWSGEALWLGLIGGVMGVLPVVMANREVVFSAYSHYALPASLVAAVFIGGLLFRLQKGLTRSTAIALLVCLAILTHNSLAMQAVDEMNTIATFWWQVSWRAPELQEKTTMLVDYPGLVEKDGVDVGNGPANLIYYPQKSAQTPVDYKISVLSNDAETSEAILLGKDRAQEYRSHTSEF